MNGVPNGGFRDHEAINAHCTSIHMKKHGPLRRIMISDRSIRCRDTAHTRTWCWCRHNFSKMYIGVDDRIWCDVYDAIDHGKAKDGITMAHFNKKRGTVQINTREFHVRNNVIVGMDN